MAGLKTALEPAPTLLSYQPTPRFVVLWVPNWSLTSLVFDTPPGTPAALLKAGIVQEVTGPALSCGVRPGMTRSLAEYHCPTLLLFEKDEAREAAAFEPLLEVFDSHAANVNVIRPGLAFAFSNAAAKWAGSEEALVRQLVEDVATETGAEIQVGIADGLGGALVAARKALVIPSGGTPDFLLELPLSELLRELPKKVVAESNETLRVLAGLGVYTGKQLLGLGVDPVVTRFGLMGQLFLELLAGNQPFISVANFLASSVETALEVDPPAPQLDWAATAILQVSEDLSRALTNKGLYSSTLFVSLQSEGGITHERTWTLLDVTSSSQVAKRITWQVRGWLGQHPERLEEPDPLAKISLAALGVTATPPEDGLWGQVRPPWKAAQAAEQIQDLLGEDAVLQPSVQGGFDPRTRVALVPWGVAEGTYPKLEGPWEGGVSDAPVIVYAKPPRAELFGKRKGAPQGGKIWVDRRGNLNGQPMHLLLEEDRHQLPAGDYPLEEGFKLWVVGGRWWAPENRLHGPRCYLRVRRFNAPDLLLVQRQGRWFVEGMYGTTDAFYPDSL